MNQVKVTFSQAINSAIHDSMEASKEVLCLGLGTPDPKGVFGTTKGLQERLGSRRVFEIPTSENAITGICIGLAIATKFHIFLTLL